MRKLLTLAAAVALLALGSASQANAFSICPQSQSVGAVTTPVVGGVVAAANVVDIAASGTAASGALVGYGGFLVTLVVCDVLDGGLNRKMADAPVGAGYHPGNLASRDDESTRLIASYRAIEENEMLASAGR